MSKPSLTHPWLAVLAAALSCSFAACTPPAIDGNGIEGEGEEGEGEGEGEGEAGPETCADAATLAAGAAVDGDNTGAADDVVPSCVAGSTSGDFAYSFTVDELASVTITLTTEADLAFALYGAGSCGEADEVECVDNSTADETLTIAQLEAGTYFVVVDGYDGAEAPFTLEVAIGAPECVNDQFEPNDTAAEAIFAGSANIDTASPDLALELTVCPADVDNFLFAHLGGALGAGAVGAGTTASVVAATVDEAASLTSLLDGGPLVVTGEGAAVTDVANAPAGYYLLKVTGPDADLNGLPYSFALTHGCEGDGADLPGALDDAVATELAPRTSTSIEGFERSLCAGDVDALIVDPVVQNASITVTVDDGTGLTLTVAETADAGGAETAVTGTETTTGTKKSVTFAGVAAKKYIVRARQTTPSAVAFAYTFDVVLDYAPPANTGCTTATGLVAGTAKTGTTVGGTNSHLGLCNGERTATPDFWGNDVSYTFTLATAANVQIAFAGETNADDEAFFGSVSMYRYPGSCPADLRDLIPVLVNGQPGTGAASENVNVACAVGETVDLRLPNVAAGDYLVIVDGVFSPGFNFLGIEIPPSITSGGYSLTVTTPATLPTAPACTDAQALTLPAVGASTNLTIAFADWSETTGLAGSCGGDGQERVYRFTPTANATLRITTPATGTDTVVYVREAGCDYALEAGCNDEAATNEDDFGPSDLTVAVRAGVEYFLVVDNFDEVAADAEVTGTIVTVAVQ
jgi:hypothetical protein